MLLARHQLRSRFICKEDRPADDVHIREQVGEVGVSPEGAQGDHARENNPGADAVGLGRLK